MNVVTLKCVHPEDSIPPSPIRRWNWQTAAPWIGWLLLLGRRLVLVLLAAAGCAFSSAQVVNYPQETGYGRLCARWHYPFTINGATITVGQAEGNLNGAYLPDVVNPDFTHVIFQVMDGDSPVSGHATDVGTLLYGVPLSLSPAVPEVKLYKADLSLNSGFLVSPTGLNWLDPAGPVDLGVDILNNSWVINTGVAPVATQLLRRADWMADAYDIVVVAGVSNDSTAPISQLFSSMYNDITVGLSDGQCSRGPTVFLETDGVTAGRCKPDIVAPLPVGSSATPVISSYAAMLLDEVHLRTAAGQTAFANGIKPVVIKSILQTGANKLPGWAKGDPTTTADDETSPLDWQQGAGQVDIDHSELILSTGAQPPGWVNWLGWTYEPSIAPGDSRLYYFILNQDTARRFAATLNWHRKISSTGIAQTIDHAVLAHLQLEFYTFADGAFTLLQASRSPIDNLQHIALPTLANGLYILRVVNVGDQPTDYGFSWGCLPAIESDIGP
ncbi:MAG TPA: hypothetical protein VFB27_12350 [Opitutaceae bacterium]|nr:hypothetical protein [Opitutaceae bacterium]